MFLLSSSNSETLVSLNSFSTKHETFIRDRKKRIVTRGSEMFVQYECFYFLLLSHPDSGLTTSNHFLVVCLPFRLSIHTFIHLSVMHLPGLSIIVFSVRLSDHRSGHSGCNRSTSRCGRCSLDCSCILYVFICCIFAEQELHDVIEDVLGDGDDDSSVLKRDTVFAKLNFCLNTGSFKLFGNDTDPVSGE